jgi:subtilisin family serine protease
VVAAAGNEGVNSDFFHFYPADYDLPNILSVGAIDKDENLMHISNYGINTVHLAAPGKNIYSTLPNGQYGYMSGTSQATAFATGVAALLIANDPQMRNPRALIQHLIKNSSRRAALRGKLRSSGLLDAKLALESSDLELTQAADNNN